MNRKTELDKENKAKQQVLVESVAEPRKQIGNTIENEVVLRKDVLKKDFNIAQEIRQSDEKKPKEAFSLISAVHKISSNIPKAITNQNEDTNARSAKEYLQQVIISFLSTIMMIESHVKMYRLKRRCPERTTRIFKSC